MLLNHHTTFNLQALQREREEKLVKILKDRLQPFVAGQTDEFVNWATAEARHLSQAGRTSSSSLLFNSIYKLLLILLLIL